MAPIRKGDGTGFTPKGFAGVRKGDGTILYSAIPDSVVDNFEADDADPPGIYASGETIVDYYRGDVGSVARASTDSMEGNHYLEVTDSNEGHQIHSLPSDGLPRYPAYGEVFSTLLYDAGGESNNPGMLYGVGENTNGVDGFLCAIYPSIDTIELYRRDDGVRTTLFSETPALDVDTLYELEIEWHDGSGTETAGTHVVNLYSVSEVDLSRTGTIATYSASDTNYTSNTGIGWYWQSTVQQTGTKTADRYQVIGAVQ